MSAHLLVVDDDPAVRASVSSALADAGYKVQTAESAEQALSRLASSDTAIVVSDIRMPGTDGLELLSLVRGRCPDVDVVLMTAYDDMPTVVRAMKEGAADFLVKPLELEVLLGVVGRVLADHQARLDRPTDPVVDSGVRSGEGDGLIGRDPRMIALYKRIGQLARSRVAVLLRGETGTGKERVARAIHAASDRAGEPFVAVNCTAVAESLLESELFGHVRGAFTGAVSDRNGRIALAGRGTLFLDEIGDTSPAFQAGLLRVLEARTYFPVGSEEVRHTEARVMAATHRDLEALVRSGEFREDLYYRLRVAELRVPPLRDRPGDIPLLARHFLHLAGSESGLDPPLLSPEAEAALLEHEWPGNVRELENSLKRAATLAGGGVVRPEHLFLGEPDASPADRLLTLDATEARQVRRALAATAGNKTRAAELLGISKPRLYRLLRKHGIDG